MGGDLLKSLLIVDDQPGISLLLEELFRKEGYETRTASNGIEAIEKIERKPPHCILLDMKMPGMNGIEILKKVKTSWPAVHVIMMTGFDEKKLVEEALANGASEYFEKPFDIDELRETVNNLLED